jgi:hypothetical protein
MRKILSKAVHFHDYPVYLPFIAFLDRWIKRVTYGFFASDITLLVKRECFEGTLQVPASLPSNPDN